VVSSCVTRRITILNGYRILHADNGKTISSGNLNDRQDWGSSHEVCLLKQLRTSPILLLLAYSFSGSILVASSDSHSAVPTSPGTIGAPDNHAPRPLLGDLLALLSAVFYALYVILLKVRIREESRIDMQLFFGFVGLVNILCCWPMGILLHLIGAEQFDLPTTRQAVVAILLNVSVYICSRSALVSRFWLISDGNNTLK
jgi:drug/metabolite transporter (DMT)-like permease